MQEEDIYALIRRAFNWPEDRYIDLSTPIAPKGLSLETLTAGLGHRFRSLDISPEEVAEATTAGGIVWMVEGKQQARQRSMGHGMPASGWENHASSYGRTI